MSQQPAPQREKAQPLRTQPERAQPESAAQAAERRRAELIDQAIGWIEDVLYVVIAIVLALCAAALVVVAAKLVPDLFRAGDETGVLEVLDAVLLVFIVVELLFAVRTTVARRELVAEPFLVVGIIASIKEIVVLPVRAAQAAGEGATFTDEVTLIGVLGVLVLLLALAAFLLRRKEREPDEGTDDPAAVEARDQPQPPQA